MASEVTASFGEWTRAESSWKQCLAAQQRVGSRSSAAERRHHLALTVLNVPNALDSGLRLADSELRLAAVLAANTHYTVFLAGTSFLHYLRYMATYYVHPRPSTLNPQPSTFYLQPSTLNPRPSPYTLHPTPCTLQPKLSTPH